MMIKRYLWLLLVLLIAGSYANAQRQICTLGAVYDIPSENYYGSWSGIGAFEFPLKEQGSMYKDFHHAESGINIQVGVSISNKSKRIKNDFDKIRLVMSFPSDYRVEAESIYDKHWKWLTVRNDIKARNRNYTFLFSCSKETEKEAKFILGLKFPDTN